MGSRHAHVWLSSVWQQTNIWQRLTEVATEAILIENQYDLCSLGQVLGREDERVAHPVFRSAFKYVAKKSNCFTLPREYQLRTITFFLMISVVIVICAMSGTP